VQGNRVNGFAGRLRRRVRTHRGYATPSMLPSDCALNENFALCESEAPTRGAFTGLDSAFVPSPDSPGPDPIFAVIERARAVEQLFASLGEDEGPTSEALSERAWGRQNGTIMTIRQTRAMIRRADLPLPQGKRPGGARKPLPAGIPAFVPRSDQPSRP
jgi:hypothetical protein